MISNKPPKCETCQWYSERRQAQGGGPFETIGECHRYPKAIPASASHFCGEHKLNSAEIDKIIANTLKRQKAC